MTPSPTRRALAAVLLSLLATSALEAQQRPRRWEVPGFDFTQDGVWRRRARAVAAERSRALGRSDLAALNAPVAAGRATPSALAVTGTIRVPVFLVAPSNRPAPFPRQQYEDVLLAATPPAGRPYTIRTFYEEMSNGLVSVQGQVFDWVTLANVDTFYEGGCNGLCGNGRVQTLMSEAIAAQDGAVDFGQFDNDGPDGIPNTSDDDGFVDVAVFVHSELGGECGGTNLWAHRFFYSGWGGSAYATNDPRRDDGGNPIPGQMIRINNYTIQSGVGGSTACTAGQMMPIGTTAHETGHGLGLPDFYDTNPSDGDDSEGIGEWGLMGSGNYATPHSPAHMEGYSRLFLGWVTVRDIAASGTYQLGPYTVGDTIFRIRPTVPNPRGEYFLLENRQGVLGDSALVRLKASGLLIWHVDSLRFAQASFSNQVNSGSIHGLDLEEADGAENLRSSTTGIRNRGDAGDPWRGDINPAFTFGSTPAARLNHNDAFVGFAIDSFAVMGQSLQFRVRFGGATTVRASDPNATVRVRGVQRASYTDVFNDGDTLSVDADSPQLSLDGMRRFAFASWSDGGAQNHIATLTTAGGDLVANFTREFRIRAAGVGGGTVTANALPADSFLAEGGSVMLTAVPGANRVFVGWVGDTVTANATLTLTATRPWTVSAAFLIPLAVSDSVLRSPTMGAAYSDTLRLSGGSGGYVYTLLSGTLPNGLTLNGTTGVIAGLPVKDSTWTFTVRAASSGLTIDLPLRLVVAPPLLVAQAVVDQFLLGTATLTQDELRYLDLVGNGNSTLDLGDIVAWLDRTGTVLPAPLAQRLFGGRP